MAIHGALKKRPEPAASKGLPYGSLMLDPLPVQMESILSAQAKRTGGLLAQIANH
jgi:hypothetical protein